MSMSHKKKRNTGLAYEFLIRTISRSLVENDQTKANAALRIIRRHFRPETGLYREFRLINSLIRTTVTSDGVANSIVQEAKLASQQYDPVKLDHEKSLLIRSINHTLKDPHFYDQHVDEYRMYATIQQLINEWRNPNKDLERQAHFEDQLVEWLTTEKKVASEQIISSESPGSNRLLMKIMMEKINEKYSSVLNERQKQLIRTYAWSTTNDDKNVINDKLLEVKESLIESIGSYIDDVTKKNDAYVVKQLSAARDKLLTEDLNEINDDTLTRFMLYLKLNDELVSKDEK